MPYLHQRQRQRQLPMTPGKLAEDAAALSRAHPRRPCSRTIACDVN
jgi:hypothetical protein